MYFYVEPNPFAVHTFEVTTGGVSSGVFSANGSAGAAYCGVYSGGGDLGEILITCTSGVDFSSGEFGWSD